MKNVLSPSKRTLISYGITVLILTFILYNEKFRINFFPCETKPVIEPSLNPQFEPDLCGLWMFNPSFTGVSMNVEVLGYLLIALVLLVLPYVICSLLVQMINRHT